MFITHSKCTHVTQNNEKHIHYFTSLQGISFCKRRPAENHKRPTSCCRTNWPFGHLVSRQDGWDCEGNMWKHRKNKCWINPILLWLFDCFSHKLRVTFTRMLWLCGTLCSTLAMLRMRDIWGLYGRPFFSTSFWILSSITCLFTASINFA